MLKYRSPNGDRNISFSFGKIRKLTEEIDSLSGENKSLAATLSEVQKELDGIIEAPDNYTEFEDGTEYWGTCVDGSPEGLGILYTEGTYYFGMFHLGQKNGTFIIINDNDVENPVIKYYENDVLIETKTKLPSETDEKSHQNSTKDSDTDSTSVIN